MFHGISSEVLPKKFSPNWRGGGGEREGGEGGEGGRERGGVVQLLE